MKKSLLFFASLICLIGNAQILPSFSITNTSGTNYITCSNVSVNYTASSNSNLTYLWVSSNATLSGASVSITIPGNYSVTATDTLNNSSVKMLSVFINTILPISTVSPNIQSITCSSPSAQFVIVVSPTPGNPGTTLTHSISSPYGAPYVLNQNASFIYNATAPGTYTYLIVDTNNDCSVVKNFTVTSTSGFPTYSITSPQNFTLGCNTKSVAVINIVNAQTNPTPGGALSFTLIGPPTNTSYIPGNISTYTVSTAGTWTAIVKDNANACETKVPFTIIQNTASPGLNVNVPQQILDCNTSQIILNGSSNTPNVTYQWSYAGTPGSSFGNTINVQTNLTAPNSTLINNYTLTLTDNNSTCKTVTVIPMYQNTFKPKAAISSGGVFALTCLIPTIALTNISSTGIPFSTGFPSSMPVIVNQWIGPPIITPPYGSTYIVSVAGTYTLEAKDLNNGCKSQTTIVIGDNSVYPQINMPGSYFVACPGTVILSAMVNGSSAGNTYSWTAPFNATTSTTNSYTLITSSPGYYWVTVSNTITGCASTASTVVQACVGLEANTSLFHNIKLFPNPNNGVFTIHSENFNNTAKLEIYNLLGVLVKTENMTSEKTSLNIQDAAKGIYIVQISENNKIIYTSKFIKD